MATDRSLRCARCNVVFPYEPLVAQLTRVADKEHCRACGEPVRLTLKFSFALGAGREECSVLAAFRPADPVALQWNHNGDTIEFRPFLVITEERDGKRSAWLPYWHLNLSPAARRPNKYGQFAPYMDLVVFLGLVEQARAAGFLDPLAYRISEAPADDLHA